jgi:DNA replication initiation complex subunit (GINS family)
MMTLEEIRKHIENRIQDLEKQIDGPEDFYYGVHERIRELHDLLTDLFSDKQHDDIRSNS